MPAHANVVLLLATSPQLLQTGGISARSYAVEDQKVRFVTDVGGFKDMVKVKAFALKVGVTYLLSSILRLCF
jgi:hypothetical protein